TYSLLFPLTRPPPLSPLFPYTTLFRSPQPGLAHALLAGTPALKLERSRWQNRSRTRTWPLQLVPASLAFVASQVGGSLLENALRSEEHTSELQSLSYLVCRLLLEKKKN